MLLRGAIHVSAAVLPITTAARPVGGRSTVGPLTVIVTVAIALWNTVYLGRAVDALRCRGEIVSDGLLAHLAPLGWQHINLTGGYLWGADVGLGPDGFRSLRGLPTTPAGRAAA